MPIVLPLLVVMIALALYLDRDVSIRDKAKHDDPPTNNLAK